MNTTHKCIPYLVRLLIIVLATIFLFFLFSATKCNVRLSQKILIVMLSLAVADYIDYWFRHRSAGSLVVDSPSAIARFIQQSRIVRKIRQKKPLTIVVVGYVLFFMISAISVALCKTITEEDIPNIMSETSIPIIIVLGLVVAPLFETVLFQVIGINLLCRITPKLGTSNNYFFAILITSLLFAICHGYTIPYMLFGFCLGLFCSSVYVLLSSKPGKTWKFGMLGVWLIHLFHNTIAFLLTVFSS